VLPYFNSDQALSAILQPSIHSEFAVKFLTTEIQTKSWASDILKNGLMPDFFSLPTPYVEPNSKTACTCKISWVGAGVAVKYFVSSDKLKYRKVLDLSQHVNYSNYLCTYDLYSPAHKDFDAGG